MSILEKLLNYEGLVSNDEMVLLREVQNCGEYDGKD